MCRLGNNKDIGNDEGPREFGERLLLLELLELLGLVASSYSLKRTFGGMLRGFVEAVEVSGGGVE